MHGQGSGKRPAPQLPGAGTTYAPVLRPDAQPQTAAIPAGMTNRQIAESLAKDKLREELSGLGPDPASAVSASQNIQGFLDTALPAAGGTVGGLVGGRMGHPVAGAGVGSAVGQMGAELTRPYLDPTITATPGEQIMEAGKNILGAGITGAAGEGILGGLTRVSQPARNGIARVLRGMFAPHRIEVGALEAQSVLEAGGSTLSAAQFTGPEARAINVLEGIGRGGFISSSGKFAARQDEAIDSVAGNLVRALGPGTSLDDVAAAKLLNLSVDDNFGKLISMVGGKYQSVSALAKSQGVSVDTTSLMGIINNSAKRKSVGKIISAAFEDTPAKLLASEPAQAGKFATSFENARAAEIGLNKYAAAAQASKNPDIQARGRLAAKMAKSISDEVDTAASKLGPDARKVYDEANALWATNVDRFRNKLITKLTDTLQTEPGRLSRLLLAEPKADTIRAVKDAIGTERFNEIVKPRLTLSMLYRTADDAAISNPDQAATMITGTSLLNQLKTLGPDFVEELMGPTGPSAKDLTNLAFALERTAMSAKGPGGFAIMLRQPGAVAQLGGAALGAGGAAAASPGAVAAGGGLIIAPPVLMRIMSSKRFVNSLAHGIDMGPAGSAIVRRVITRATTQAALQSQRDSRRIQRESKLPYDADKNMASLERDVTRPERHIPLLGGGGPSFPMR